MIVGLNEKSKGNDPFIDLQPGNNRLDKIRQEKLKRFRESITNKFSLIEDNDDHRVNFTLPWKDNGEFQVDDFEYQRYLRTLNATIFLRIKSLSERQFDLAPLSNSWKPFQRILYHETLVHLTHYSKISSHTCLGLGNFLENHPAFKQWFTRANQNEHYPLLILGNRASGKTLLSTKLVQYLVNTLGKNNACLVRYFNLTSRSKNIGEIFTSICLQMSTFPQAPSLADEQEFNRIEYYQTAMTNFSQNQKPIILMIDGIEEATQASQYASSIIYYQTLFQLLPAKVFRNNFHSTTCCFLFSSLI